MARFLLPEREEGVNLLSKNTYGAEGSFVSLSDSLIDKKSESDMK